MIRKIIGLLLIVVLLAGPGCQLIYPNRIPVTKPKKRYGWYHPRHKKKKRTRTVWMKVHQPKKRKGQAPASTPESEDPNMYP
jgi:hypothetical protein